MSNENYIKRLIRLDHLIHIKSTGSPSELAQKLGMSERSVFEDLKTLRTFGARISYNRGRKSYFYVVEGRFKIGFEESSEN